MENQLILHGIIILFIGVVSGYAFSKAIQNQPEKQVAWRVVHSGGSMAGIMLMAFGSVWEKLQLTGISGKVPGFWLGTGLLFSTYLLIAGMIIAAITGQRGLASTSQGAGKLVFLCYAIGAAISTIVLGGIIIWVVFK
jgi:hypothetical protein